MVAPAPEVLADILRSQFNHRYQFRLVAATMSSKRRRLIPPRNLHPTAYALTADLSHVTSGNKIQHDSPFASAIGVGRGILMTFRMPDNMLHICVDRKDRLGKPAVS
jgi:hypothetical protein